MFDDTPCELLHLNRLNLRVREASITKSTRDFRDSAISKYKYKVIENNFIHKTYGLDDCWLVKKMIVQTVLDDVKTQSSEIKRRMNESMIDK